MVAAFKKFEATVKRAAAALPRDKASYFRDSGGLYVQLSAVRPDLTDEEARAKFPLGRPASWVFRYRSRANGQRRTMGLGPYHDVSLAAAREQAAKCRDQLRNLIDPLDARREARATLVASASKTVTFDEAVEKYIAAHRAGWKNPKHAAQWEATLSTYASPVMGKLPAQLVGVTEVMKVLEPIWQTKSETASRLRGRIEAVLSWAAVRGYRDQANPARWKGHLEHLLKSRQEMAGAGLKAARVEHHAALPFAEIHTFIQALRKQPGIAAMALEFTILTAARTGETIGAAWDEISMDAGVWTISADRMKMKREHVVPLSDRCMEILRAMEPFRKDGSTFVFPGAKQGRGLSNMSMLMLLQRMGRKDLTVHGFRSCFRDWASETTAHERDVVEMALAHSIPNKAEAAYRRGSLLDKRRRLMDDWARRCRTEDAAAAKVVRMRPVAS